MDAPHLSRHPRPWSSSFWSGSSRSFPPVTKRHETNQQEASLFCYVQTIDLRCVVARGEARPIHPEHENTNATLKSLKSLKTVKTSTMNRNSQSARIAAIKSVSVRCIIRYDYTIQNPCPRRFPSRGVRRVRLFLVPWSRRYDSTYLYI